jgi:hypothetical protein
MLMYPSVKSVEPNDNHTLSVIFDNGEQGVLDMKPYLHFGVFQRLRPIEKFQQVRVSFDTVAWACGVDLDPEFVYDKSEIGPNS